MSSPAEVLFHYILDQGAASDTTGSAWELFISFLPDTPDEAICILDTAGKNDGRVMATGERIDHSGIQLQIRGRDYWSAYVKASELASLLDGIRNTVVIVESAGVYTVQNVSRQGTIIPIGIDQINDKRRHNFTINALVTLYFEDSESLTADNTLITADTTEYTADQV